MHVIKTAEAAAAHLAANTCLVSMAAYVCSRHRVDKTENVQNPVLAASAAVQAACHCVGLS